ncbi:MAG: zinc ribbon domain-containing protein [Pyrinomonadaceae bacterium]|nr:zinc ribbon domain-containing protein [Pyrinomonadaceae bacterium]
MYCSGCGSPIAPGLSFCNRCGTSLKERSEFRQTGAISAIVTAMVLVALASMGLLLGGPIALKREGGFDEELIVLFMFLTFLICAFSEIFLYRQLGRLTNAKREPMALPSPAVMQAEFRAPQPLSLAEPAASVTENTTRTLEYSREEGRRPRTP